MTITFNDRVDDIVQELWSDENFTRYLEAIYDSQAVEGSLAVDDIMAALMIRNKAKTVGYHAQIASANLTTILKALKVVLRRHCCSRRDRWQEGKDFIFRES